MTSNFLDVRHLRYFVAIFEARSFRTAALKLHISQPPLTRQIQQLEEFLDTQLLIRKPRGVEPTAAGEAFYNEAKNILQLLERAVDTARLAGEGQLGRLDIAGFGSAVLDLVPRVILAFREQYPKVEIVLHNMNREDQIKALRERRITVGFNRFFDLEPDLEWEVLLSEKMAVAVPAQHPFAERESVSLADIAREPLIFYPRVPRPEGFTEALMRMFHRRELSPNVIQEVNDVMTAIAFVASGQGLTLIVQSAKALTMKNVVYVDIVEQDSMNFDLAMIHRKDDESPLLEAFLSIAREVPRSK